MVAAHEVHFGLCTTPLASMIYDSIAGNPVF